MKIFFNKVVFVDKQINISVQNPWFQLSAPLLNGLITFLKNTLYDVLSLIKKQQNES
jgi:hypothetical protein